MSSGLQVQQLQDYTALPDDDAPSAVATRSSLSCAEVNYLCSCVGSTPVQGVHMMSVNKYHQNEHAPRSVLHQRRLLSVLWGQIQLQPPGRAPPPPPPSRHHPYNPAKMVFPKHQARLEHYRTAQVGSRWLIENEQNDAKLPFSMGQN